MNKFSLILFLFFSLIVFSCSDKKAVDCRRFKKGKFLLKSTTGNNQVIITRDSTIQTELDQRTDTLTGGKIYWTSECEYELVPYYKMPHFSDTANKDLRAVINLTIRPLKVKIIKASDDYYVFEALKDGINFLYRDTLWVIKLF